MSARINLPLQLNLLLLVILYVKCRKLRLIASRPQLADMAKANADVEGPSVEKKLKPLPALNYSAMDRPMYLSDFVETKAWEKAKVKMADPEVTVLTFSGSTGSGKSTLAMELSAEIFPHHENPEQANVIFRLFNCETLSRFYSDLALFYRDLEKKQKKLSSDHDRKWDILISLFNDMNQDYSDYVKLFILDDVENIADILDKLNHICRVIRPKEALKGKWKFLLTSQKQAANAYPEIPKENFMTVDGFDIYEVRKLFRFSGIDDTAIGQITDVVGTRPLTLKICLSSLKSNQIDDISDSVQTLLKNIETETSVLVQGGQQSREKSALVAIKLSIGRLLEELPNREVSEQILKILTMFNEKNITTELLVACAETCIDRPEQASTIVNQLISRMIERGICTKKQESSFILFSLHQLVKQSMKLFVKDEEKKPLITQALIALTRVMPKDDRKHQARLVGFYGNHGKSLDAVIKSMQLQINREQTPFIMFLHCHMLVAMGYCLLAKRAEDHREGVQRLEEARDRYCDLVLGATYASTIPSATSGPTDPLHVELNLARRLFAGSKNLDLSSNEEYQQYIKSLPLFHRLTQKDLSNMVEHPEEMQLVNEHLSENELENLKMAKKVLDDDILAKQYLAEVLAQIFCVWSKVHRLSPDNKAAVNECIIQAEAAVEIYKRIFEEYKVYLLAGLITERDLLSTKLQAAKTANEVERILSQLIDLSNVGQDSRKKNAYEAGLLRSDLSKDSYHKLLCMETSISCQGRLYEFTADEAHYNAGKRLFDEVETLASSQVYNHSALSVSHRTYAAFLFNCKKYGEAVVHLLRAMLELHKSLLKKTSPLAYPELTHPRFKILYSRLQSYYDKFQDERERTLGGEEVKNADKLLTVDMVECTYVMGVIDSLSVDNNSAVDGSSSHSANQPTESSNTVDLLDTIHDNEIQDIGMAFSHSV